MTAARRLFPVIVVFLAAANLRASGDVGIYGIVERVVFEPNERTPQRIQVWGAFAYVDVDTTDIPVSSAKRGYFYFTLRDPEGKNNAENAATLAEWNDLKAVAGTGQAIAFGRWDYTGKFASLDPNMTSSELPHIYERQPGIGARMGNVRVRPEAEAPASPAIYQTNIGVVKLSETGSHADLVKALRAALQR
jgi:hypothetical protein